MLLCCWSVCVSCNCLKPRCCGACCTRRSADSTLEQLQLLRSASAVPKLAGLPAPTVHPTAKPALAATLRSRGTCSAQPAKIGSQQCNQGRQRAMHARQAMRGRHALRASLGPTAHAVEPQVMLWGVCHVLWAAAPAFLQALWLTARQQMVKA
jgi:hypothetical protein